MKHRKKIALGAALTGVTLGFGGCFGAEVQDVYGPPPDEPTSIQEEIAPIVEETTAFSPADMTVAPLYGPPDVMCSNEETDDASAAAEESAAQETPAGSEQGSEETQ